MRDIILALAATASLTGTAHTVDGDTLRVGNELVRLSGVDAPELSQNCGAEARRVACGAMAAAWLRSRVDGNVIDCVEVGRDRYDRRIAVCRVDGMDLGAALVEAGWAAAYRQYSITYVDAEARARASRRG